MWIERHQYICFIISSVIFQDCLKACLWANICGAVTYAMIIFGAVAWTEIFEWMRWKILSVAYYCKSPSYCSENILIFSLSSIGGSLLLLHFWEQNFSLPSPQMWWQRVRELLLSLCCIHSNNSVQIYCLL